MVNLSKIIIPNTELEAWIRSFGVETKKDYGFEYLIAVTDGRIKKIPDIDRYTLSPYLYVKLIKESTLDNIPKKKLASLLGGWNRGKKPFSIQALDKLRQHPSSPYYIDLLKPQSYDGTFLNINGIPLSHPFLKSLSYLTASIICGGMIKKATADATISPPNKRNVPDFGGKIRDCVIKKMQGKQGPFQLKRPYTNLLLLTGNRNGDLINAKPEALEIPYLTRLISYVKAKVLSPSDRTHAVSVIRGFVEGVIDHKISITSYGSKVITLQHFTNQETAMAFQTMYREAFDISFPNVRYSLEPLAKSLKQQNKVYYTSIMILSKKEAIA